MFKEEIGKIISFVHGFSEQNRTRLARMMVLWIADGHLPPNVLQLMLKVAYQLPRAPAPHTHTHTHVKGGEKWPLSTRPQSTNKQTNKRM